MKEQSSLQTYTYYIDGMHCASCELLIEKKALSLSGVESVEASLQNNSVTLVSRENVSPQQLNQLCQELGYTFSQQKKEAVKEPIFYVTDAGVGIDWKQLWKKTEKLSIAVIILIALFLVERLQLGKFIDVGGTQTLVGVFILAIVASISSCAALIGGLLLSLTKQWHEQSIDETRSWVKAQPHLAFHAGRFFGFVFFGAVLGGLGRVISFDNTTIYAMIVLVVSLIMVILALQMLEVRFAKRIQFRMPKAITRLVANDTASSRAPALIGIGTFFLPCGFTLVAQGLALTSGNVFQGALIMGLFALGTLPMLALISTIGLRVNKQPRLTAKFNLYAGILVLLFALYNINGQFNVLGWWSISDAVTSPTAVIESENSANTIAGKQIISLTAKGFRYTPTSSMTIEAGVPTILVVDDQGIQGCGVFLTVSGLVKGFVPLEYGRNEIDLGTPKAGTYKITCSMGMVPPVVLKVI